MKKISIPEDEYKKLCQAKDTLDEQRKEKEKEELWKRCSNVLVDYIEGVKYEFWPNEIKRTLRHHLNSAMFTLLMEDNQRRFGA